MTLNKSITHCYIVQNEKKNIFTATLNFSSVSFMPDDRVEINNYICAVEVAEQNIH